MVVKTTSDNGPFSGNFNAAFTPGQEEELAAHERRQAKERLREETNDDS